MEDIRIETIILNEIMPLEYCMEKYPELLETIPIPDCIIQALLNSGRAFVHYMYVPLLGKKAIGISGTVKYENVMLQDMLSRIDVKDYHLITQAIGKYEFLKQCFSLNRLQNAKTEILGDGLMSVTFHQRSNNHV